MIRDIPGLFAILLLSLLAALTANFLSPSGIALKGQWDKDKGVIFARGKTQMVSPELDMRNPMEVKKIVDTSSMTIVDVRPGFAYEQGHIPGALSYPTKNFDQIMESLTKTYPEHTPLLLYCSGFACTDAHRVATKLVEQGFSIVRVFTGGFEEWQEMGFPIENSEK